MMTVALLILAALSAIMPAAAQPLRDDCPLPPYQLPLLPPAPGVVEDGQFFISGQDTPVTLPDGLIAVNVIWSDDGEVALIEAQTDEVDYRIFNDIDYRVFSYSDGTLTELLDQAALMAVRDEEFAAVVTLFNPAFIPGTHTVLTNTRIMPNGGGIYFEIPRDLWSLDVDSGEFTTLLPYGEAGQFSISPDGQYLVIETMQQMLLTDINGQNARVITDDSPAIGVGEAVQYAPVVWLPNAEQPTFRTLMFPAYDPLQPKLSLPYELREYTISDDITVEVLMTGPTDLLFTAVLSPDGASVAQWSWDNNNNPNAMVITAQTLGGEQVVLAKADTTNPGSLVQFIEWADATHITFGWTEYMSEGQLVSSWRVDLCGDVVALEPYTITLPGM